MNTILSKNTSGQPDKPEILPAGLFFPGKFGSFRIFSWYAVTYLAFCFIASLIMNRSVSDGNLVWLFGYIVSFVFGFLFLIENRCRWFNCKIVSFLFVLSLVLWAIFSIPLAYLFVLNTVFIGGIP